MIFSQTTLQPVRFDGTDVVLYLFKAASVLLFLLILYTSDATCAGLFNPKCDAWQQPSMLMYNSTAGFINNYTHPWAENNQCELALHTHCRRIIETVT